MARSLDGRCRVYNWNIRNHRHSSIFYTDVQDQSNNIACITMIHEPDIHCFHIGPDFYSASYDHCTLFRLLHGETEHRPVGPCFRSLEEIVIYYQNEHPEWRPIELPAYNSIGDCQLLSFDLYINRAPEFGNELGVSSSSTADAVFLSPRLTNVVLEPTVLALDLEDPQGHWFMKLPEGEQTEEEIKEFARKVKSELRALNQQQVKCPHPKCKGKDALCDSKDSTLERHLRPHFHLKDTCDICLDKFANKENTRRHKEAVHHICRTCEFRFENQTDLLAHKENMHYICEICGKRSNGGPELLEHKQKDCAQSAAAAKGKGRRARGAGLRETGKGRAREERGVR
ncbi:hypothetical protein BDV93DRAFT_606565 [Ceratobasidium sp. AG-I]|nr:hypothetical protein BDV93DRAFT_606565 [Ceratobasidium sp. AG-I]